MKRIVLSLIFTITLGFAYAQALAQNTQNIRGQILDTDSKYPVIGANVIVVGTEPIIGSSTDIDGNFELLNVSVGRVNLQITAIGYEEVYATNLLLVAGKELQVNFTMKESLTSLEEVVVVAGEEKEKVNNELATVSARSFNTEETGRYAGSRNDPARMAANFAGVSGANDSRNDIIIRGNSPTGLLWRLEGIDIPSPNHFASFGSTGGPVSMLNNNLLAKSDFMTAAFPANYGNALAGVFDLQMRKGNSSKREYLAQVGFNGFEFGAEGPFSKNSNASYLINYRYSTLGVLSNLGVSFGTGAAVPNFQDLSFKFDFPTKKAGKFTIFGLGGTSDIEFLGSETDFTTDNVDLFGNENQDLLNETQTGIIGISHTYYFNPKTYYKLSLAATHQQARTSIDSLEWSTEGTDINLIADIPFASINFNQNKYIANLTINRKFNVKNTITAGVIATLFDINFADSARVPISAEETAWQTIKRGEGQSTLGQAYANWQHRFSDRLTMNLGVHGIYYSLAGSASLSPRLGLRYQPDMQSSINFGYGLHHQMQILPIYYTRRPDGSLSNNQDLGFTRSQHFALGYDRSLGNNFRIKSEVYYQALDNVPVEPFSSSFSVLNVGADFGTPDEFDLVNEGKGRNYGVELTLEKFYSNQTYFLLTTSLFKAEYQGSDEVWRSTAFDGEYVINLLGGKEWTVGKRQNTLGIDFKGTVAGGRKFTPIDLEASGEAGFEVLRENEAFSQQFDDYFRADVKVSYRMNRKKTTHEFSLDIQNITNRQNVFIQQYNRRTNSVTTEYQLGLFPVPQYRLLF